jgi:hypothetical protein
MSHRWAPGRILGSATRGVSRLTFIEFLRTNITSFPIELLRVPTS